MGRGALLPPGEPEADSVDLARALYALAGVPVAGGESGDPEGLVLTGPAVRLREAIGQVEHYVVVLVDALGRDQLARCPPGGFLRSHASGELRAVFPSSTAPALTSMATAEHPARHGIPGWWVRLVDRGVTATVLPFEERDGGDDLRDRGVRPEEVFLLPPILPRLGYAPLAVVPGEHVDGAFVGYFTGGVPAVGYGDLHEGVRRVERRVLGAATPTYTYLYLPEVDTLLHDTGVDSDRVEAALAAIDAALARLRDRLPPEARVVVTGDHGQVALPPDRALPLEEGDPLLEHLECPPTGDPTVPIFHLRRGAAGAESFRDAFRGRYGDAFALLGADEVEAMGLLGPSPLSPVTRGRLGHLVGISREPTALYFVQAGGALEPDRGVHGGLTSGEVVVPLVVA